jgi:short-subunit dehydrogenase
MLRDLRGRRLLITGASRGIGSAVAERAAARGARLALVARSSEALDALGRRLRDNGVEVWSRKADITSEHDRQGLLESIVAHWGGLDVLVNNAGVASWGHFGTSSEEVLRQVMEVNFFAPAELIRAAVPLLMRGTQPAVVNVTSMCGRRGMPAWSEYSASKFALCGLTEALRGEMARFDIDVLLIVPGLTRSGLAHNMLRSAGREDIDFTAGMAPEAVARQIVSALEKNRTETVVGSDARWLLGVNRFLPGLVDRLIRRRVRRLYEQAGTSAPP